jgi:hypothetical protein
MVTWSVSAEKLKKSTSIKLDIILTLLLSKKSINVVTFQASVTYYTVDLLVFAYIPED